MQMNFTVSAPNLKGRPRRKRKKRSLSPGGSESNESEESSLSTVSSTVKVTVIVTLLHFSGQEFDAALQIICNAASHSCNKLQEFLSYSFALRW